MAHDMPASASGSAKPAASKAKGSNSKKRGRPSATASSAAAASTTAASGRGGVESSSSSTVSSVGVGTAAPENGQAGPIQVQYIPRKNVDANDFAEVFWRHQFGVAETLQEDFKTPELPLARVKRVMKTDPEVAMIASEVPVILEKACQIFIADLTARAYIDSPKRRTLTRADVSRAARQTDMFDFLIDILPRESIATSTNTNHASNTVESSRRNSLNSQQ